MNKWTHKISLGDVFRSASMSFEERRDEIVARIERTRWYDAGGFDLLDLVDELADADTVEEFDSVWSRFYDYADVNRIWVETIR